MAHEKGNDGIKKFTWRQLCSLNKPENAHVAYNGKVNREMISFCKQKILLLLKSSWIIITIHGKFLWGQSFAFQKTYAQKICNGSQFTPSKMTELRNFNTSKFGQ